MHNDIFTQLSLIIVIAAVISIVMRWLRQPLLVGYILTGIIVGPTFLNLIHDKSAFETFSEIGIALLLFIIGLELSLSVVRRLGKAVLLTAFGLFFTIATIGYLLATAYHFNQSEALIVGLALFFSSTIIIAKVLSDKKEITRLNGQIAIGVILVDDIIATFALLFIAAQTGGPLTPVDIGLLVLKGAAVVAGLFVVGAKVLPPVTKYIAKSQELLFVFALAWGFGVASLINAIGFSVEVGALFAGVSLAHLPYTHQIGAKLKPLRDFFIILFFISLGESLELNHVGSVVAPALVFSAVVLIVKPNIVMAILGLLGYTKRTSFKAGINLSQISEFSIILVVLAQSAGIVSARLSALITLVALITIAASTYLMKYDNWIFAKLEKHLQLFERRETSEAHHRDKEYPLVLIGYENGQQFIKTFRSMHSRFVVIDYDPEAVEELEKRHINYLYGDATDPILLDEVNFAKARLIVSTVSVFEVNMQLLEYVRKHNKDAIIICYSNDHNHAADLYEMGATYVMLPHYIGSQQLSQFIQDNGLNHSKFDSFREKHLVELSKHTHREIQEDDSL